MNASVLAVLKKFTSRKFLMSLIGVITGVCGIITIDESWVGIIVFGVIQVASIVSYVISEGKVDAESVKQTITLADDIKNMIEDLKAGKTDDLPKAQDQIAGIVNSAAPNSTTTITVKNKTEEVQAPKEEAE